MALRSFVVIPIPICSRARINGATKVIDELNKFFGEKIETSKSLGHFLAVYFYYLDITYIIVTLYVGYLLVLRCFGLWKYGHVSWVSSGTHQVTDVITTSNMGTRKTLPHRT